VKNQASLIGPVRPNFIDQLAVWSTIQALLMANLDVAKRPLSKHSQAVVYLPNHNPDN
tara:strand:- start:494 stop:667 length:174 start_codon:yes stop_codon:yes gene_type:complete